MQRDPRAPALLALLLSVALLVAWLVARAGSKSNLATPAMQGPQAPRPKSTAEDVDLNFRCPPHQLPSLGVCVPVPTTPKASPSWLLAEDHASLLRNPDHPSSFQRYRWPAAISPQTRFNGSQSLAHEQGLRDAAITLEGARPVQARLPQLSQQIGAALVLYVGPALGGSVVTLHHLKRLNEDVQYVLILANLERTAPDLSVGMSLAEGALVGEAGPSRTGEPTDASLWLDCYRLAKDHPTSSWRTFPKNLHTDTGLTPVDLRDVLPYL